MQIFSMGKQKQEDGSHSLQLFSFRDCYYHFFFHLSTHTHTEKKGVWHTKETTSTVYALLPYTITNMLNNRHKSKDCTSRASLARLPGAPFLIQHLFFIIKFFSIVRQMKKKRVSPGYPYKNSCMYGSLLTNKTKQTSSHLRSLFLIFFFGEEVRQKKKRAFRGTR